MHRILTTAILAMFPSTILAHQPDPPDGSERIITGEPAEGEAAPGPVTAGDQAARTGPIVPQLPPESGSWRKGRINVVSLTSDGRATIRLDGWVRNNCTCDASHPDMMCIDRQSDLFRETYAMVLSAAAQDLVFNAFIGDKSCTVKAAFIEP